MFYVWQSGADQELPRQDPRLQGRAPGFRGEGYQVRDKTGIRQGQDRDKTETSQGQDKEKTGTRYGKVKVKEGWGVGGDERSGLGKGMVRDR